LFFINFLWFYQQKQPKPLTPTHFKPPYLLFFVFFPENLFTDFINPNELQK